MNQPVQLSSLPPGSQARVVALELEGEIRRRLLDLGFVPNAAIRILRQSPGGGLTAYRVKGTTVCLRAHDAERIQVVSSVEAVMTKGESTI